MHRPMPTRGKAKSTKSTILSAEETLAPSSPAAGAVLVGFHQDPRAHLAVLIIQRHIGALPDLTHCIVLLPDTLAAPRLRRHMLAAAAHHGVTALLGPQILSLRSYAMRHADGDGATLSPQARELLLVEILDQHSTLFGASDPWLLAADLGRLFAELTLQQSTQTDDLGQFIARLRNAYGTALPLAALVDEARLVHTLWQAWHRQLRDAGELDPDTTYLAALRSALDRDDRCIFFMAGYSELAPPERASAQRQRHQRPPPRPQAARAARARRRWAARCRGLGLVHHGGGGGAGTLAGDARRGLRPSAAHRSPQIAVRIAGARPRRAARGGASFRTGHSPARERRPQSAPLSRTPRLSARAPAAGGRQCRAGIARCRRTRGRAAAALS